MMKIKTAQTSDFTDVSVRRIFGYANDALQTQMHKLMEAEQELVRTNPYITMQELATSSLGENLRGILGSDHWSFNPDQGIL